MNYENIRLTGQFVGLGICLAAVASLPHVLKKAAGNKANHLEEIQKQPIHGTFQNYTSSKAAGKTLIDAPLPIFK